ncbi:MAG TPA: hypothetical protein VHO50_13135, partial [Bacteroidales bacterium]|nr:hypothetical protein [Bacteroidales bacterium]
MKALLATDPDNILYNGIMAEILINEGQKDRALDLYELMLEKHPGDGQIQLAIAEFLAGEKDYKRLFNILNTLAINENITREEKISFFGRLVEDIDK